MTGGQQPTTGNGRRSRWARRENARREAAYRQSLSTWQAEAAELDWMATTARSFVGSPHATVVLKRGEVAFSEYSAARLVEAQGSIGDDLGGYSAFSYATAKGIRHDVVGGKGTHLPGADELKIIDAGPVTITDQRVLLQASHNREWAFTKLLGIWHDDTRPLTLMAVSNRKKISGLLYAPRSQLARGATPARPRPARRTATPRPSPDARPRLPHLHAERT